MDAAMLKIQQISTTFPLAYARHGYECGIASRLLGRAGLTTWKIRMRGTKS
jgi:hypothetical protein